MREKEHTTSRLGCDGGTREAEQTIQNGSSAALLEGERRTEEGRKRGEKEKGGEEEGWGRRRVLVPSAKERGGPGGWVVEGEKSPGFRVLDSLG